MVSTQKRNSERVDLLRPDFQARYEPNFAYGNVAGIHQALAGLRGYWPLTSLDSTPQYYDLSGQGRVLTSSGNVYVTRLYLAGYAYFTGAQYLYRADEGGLDILGTETYVSPAGRGLALGAWVNFTNAASALEIVMSKYNATGNQRSYRLGRSAAGNLSGLVSVDGTAVTTVTSTETIAANTWTHVALQFIPSTSLSVFVNGNETQNAVAIPASIFNSTSDLFFGALQGAATSNYITGSMRDCFLCVSSLSDTIIKNIYQQTRAMFGV